LTLQFFRLYCNTKFAFLKRDYSEEKKKAREFNILSSCFYEIINEQML